MRKLFCRVLPFILLAVMPLSAFASVSSLFLQDGTTNTLKFINREVFLRVDATGNWTPVSDPNRGLMPGDLLVSMYRGTDLLYGPNLTSSGWNPGDANGHLLGYSVQEIASVSAPAFLPFVAITYQNSKVDPFGVFAADLARGDQVKIFDSTQDWDINTSTAAGIWWNDLKTSVDNTINLNGTKSIWESFTDADGIGPNDFADSVGTLFAGNNANILASFGLTAQGDSTFSFVPTDWLGRGTLNDIGGNTTVKYNKDFAIGIAGKSPWMYDSNDPMVFAAVPEPATLAMWAGFLAIGAVVALRRRQK